LGTRPFPNGERMKGFDYYIFIDYSEKLIGYLIIDDKNIPKLIPKISKFAHYKNLKHKSLYIKSIKKRIKKENILSLILKTKIRKIIGNLEIYSDVLDFLKKHDNCLIFVSIDNHEYQNFRKMVNIVDGEKIVVKKESELKKESMEYQLSLVLDTLLNIKRLSLKNG